MQHNLATQLTRAALLAVQSFRTRRRVGAAGKRSGPRWLYARLLLTARPCLSRTKPIGNNCDPRTSNFFKNNPCDTTQSSRTGFIFEIVEVHGRFRRKKKSEKNVVRFGLV